MPKRSRVYCAFVLALAALCCNCARVNTAPFTDFDAGLKTLRTGVETQAAADVDNSRSRFVAQVTANPESLPDLQLQFNPPFGYEYSFGDEPLYVKLTRFRQGLKLLNDAMVEYSGLLVRLSGDETIDPSRFDTLTRDLNGNAVAAASALRLNLPANETALLSTAAIAIFREIIERKRRKELTRAIEAVQPQVTAYSSAIGTAIEFLATGVTTDYDDQVRPLIMPPGDLAGVMALNEKTVATLEALSRIDSLYAKLPEAHADLAEAANERPGALPGIIDFTNEALRLHRLSEELATANAAAANPSN